VSGAVALAKVTSEDPFAGLPESEAFGQVEEDQHLYFEDVNEMPPAERIEIARRSEAAAMAYDTRITNSGGGDFDTSTSHKIMVNSRGFVGEYRKSYCGFSASPIAQGETGGMQRNYWYSNSRTTRLLESPEEIGQEAARRTLKRLGARQVKTQAAPVVFSPEIAGMRSIAMRASSRTNWVNRWRARTSPWSTTALSYLMGSVGLGPRRSMAKGCQRGGR
jgi:PmbA protein